MATIKSLLEKAMLRLGSRGGRNSNESVWITVDKSSDKSQQFTAPTDGMYVAMARAVNDTSYIWMDDGSGSIWACRALFTNGSITFSFPVKKGATASIQWVSMTESGLLFVKSIGGCS